MQTGRTVAEMVTEKSGQTGEKVELAILLPSIEAPLLRRLTCTSNKKLGTILVGFNKEIRRRNGRTAP